jgi:hypothetical protein
VALEADPRFHGFQPGASTTFEGLAHLYAGRVDRCLDIWATMAAHPAPGLERTAGRGLLMWLLPAAGRAEEARIMADETLAEARAHGNPSGIGVALAGYGRAFAETDPPRALRAYREGLQYCREQRVLSTEAVIARDAAGLEALHGRPDDAGELFDTTMDTYLRAGDHPSLAITLAHLGVFFDRVEQPEVAATLYGASTRYDSIVAVPGLPVVVEHLRAGLGADVFDRCVATGAGMELGEAVAYAHRHIRLIRRPSNPLS